MLAETFATDSLPASQQLDAWRAWYDTIFDVTPSREGAFGATNSTWTIQGLTLSRVASPANTVSSNEVSHSPQLGGSLGDYA